MLAALGPHGAGALVRDAGFYGRPADPEPTGPILGVGQSLGRNPFPIIVPCHRVLGVDGKVGGFSAPGGVTTKMRMLAIEKAQTGEAPMLFDAPLAIAPRRG